jgi:hypothetical protein
MTVTYLYSMAAGRDVTEDERCTLKRLFDEHYGEWSPVAKRPATRVRISRMKFAGAICC